MNVKEEIQLLLIAFWFIVCTGAQTSKEKLTQVGDECKSWKLETFPQAATANDIHDYDDRLDQFTLESFTANKNKVQKLLDELEDVVPSDLNSNDLNTYEVLKAELNQYIEGYEWREYGALNPINFLEGVQRIPHWIGSMRFRNKDDFRLYEARMIAYPEQVHQVINLMTRAINLNRTNHNSSMTKVPGQIQNDIKPAIQSAFFEPYTSSLESSSVPEAEREAMRTNATLIIEDINTSLQGLRDFIVNQYMPATRTEYGVWSFDDGDNYYKACLKFHTSTDITPQEIHDMGNDEVTRINGLMTQIMVENGFTGTVAEFTDHLRTNERHKYYDKTEEWLLTEYRRIVNDVLGPKMLDIFHTEAPVPVIVAKMPYDGAGGSYSRPLNTFYVNTNRPQDRPTFPMVALTAHETNPGHHYQLSTAAQLDQPEFRTMINTYWSYAVPFGFPWHTAYTEGWGLYAEFLGEEMGAYNKTALELFGRYSSEIFRACRLVVDTGIHAFKMTRQEAIDMMAANTAVPQNQIENEIDRYITWPGQACAYKIGELQFRKWRQEANDELGSKFDVRDFHKAIIDTGSAPLKVPERAINDYVEANKEVEEPSSANKMVINQVIVCITVTIVFIFKNI